MNVLLPDPPTSLPPAPRAFYEELGRMLAAVQPPRLSSDGSAVRFDGRGLAIDLIHSDRDDWGIWATVGERDAIVATSHAHEHFFAPSEEIAERRPWTAEIVDFIAEILRGEVEIVTTFRGETAISVEHFNLDESGERQLLGRTGFLVPARLFPWRPKRVETERVSFR
jgi:hypothetical protein